MKQTDVLIVGNGIAGHSAAKEFRKHDKESSITIVSGESRNTYYRIKLSSCLAKGIDDSFSVNDDSWYLENNIDVILKKIVIDVNFDNKIAKLDDGTTIAYKKLLLALGSRPFIPPIKGKQLPGVFALRTVDDLLNISEYVEGKNKIAVLGGGLLGLEAAWSFRELGKEVVVINSSAYLLDRQLDEETGLILNELVKSKGIDLLTNVSINEIKGIEGVSSVELSDGSELRVDMLLISTGVRPNIGLVMNTQVEVDRGVIVNEKMETTCEGVYAAGDICEFNGQNIGLWTSGNEQGKVAGAFMAGANRNYEKPKIFTSLQIGDINVFSAGDVKKWDKVHSYRENGTLKKVFSTNGVLTGVILMGDIRDMNAMIQMLDKREDIDTFLRTSKFNYSLEA
ncbi:MAG: NAD(P)/FAD-dependent oxidoreductase [Tissierellia bacterium]|nr:NAD(P)/FAD-dependent oxidoreductase [Tissierellia bacterium]